CRRVRGQVRIDVYDTGLGIPQSKKKVIFREFQRLDEGAKVARGLGLGLSIVERIARVLDHKVDLISTVGRGSRFSVEIPRGSAAPAREPPRDIVSFDRSQLLGSIVLCIDNEPTVVDGMEAMLSGWGCQVIKAPDLATAIAAVAEAQTPPNGLLV